MHPNWLFILSHAVALANCTTDCVEEHMPVDEIWSPVMNTTRRVPSPISVVLVAEAEMYKARRNNGVAFMVKVEYE